MSKLQLVDKAISRENNYDFLRVIATIAVIAIHVSASWIDLARAGVEYGQPELIFIHCINCISRFAVPCFVMLSGAFLLSDARNKDFRAFYRKIFKKIVIPMVIFSALYFIPQVVVALAKGNMSSAFSALLSMLAGKPAVHMWYLFMMLIVYALVPVIIILKDTIGEKKFGHVAWAFLLLAMVSFCTGSHALAWDIGMGFQYCGYLMVGYEIRRKNKSRGGDNLFGFVYIVLGLMTGALLALLNYSQEYNMLPSALSTFARVAPLCPLPLLSSILVFCGFSRLKIKHNFKSAQHTFMIYLFHAGIWYAILLPLVKRLGLAQEPIIILGCVIAVAIISLILSIIYNLIWRKMDSKWNIPDRLSRIIFH